MPLSSRVRSPATGTARSQRREQVGAHQHLAATGRRGDAGGPGDGRAEVVAVARASPRRRGARCARWERSRARRDVERGPAGSRPRTRCRRRAGRRPRRTRRRRASPPRRAIVRTRRAGCGRASAAAAPRRRRPSPRPAGSTPRCRRTGTCGGFASPGSGRGGAMSRSTAAPISSTGASGGLDLEAGAGVVAVGRQRPGQPHARLGGFVGGVDLAPGADALLQRGDRRLGVAAVERQLATRHRGRGRRSGRAEPSSQLLELGDALAGRLARRPPPGTRVTCTGSTKTRRSRARKPGSARARVRLRTAACASPCASSRRPRPGWPSSPKATACASASSAPARSPRRTRMSTSSL